MPVLRGRPEGSARRPVRSRVRRIAHRIAQELEAPAVGIAAQAMLIGADQHGAVGDDLEEVGECGRVVTLDVYLHVDADMTGREQPLADVGGAGDGRLVKALEDVVGSAIETVDVRDQDSQTAYCAETRPHVTPRREAAIVALLSCTGAASSPAGIVIGWSILRRTNAPTAVHCVMQMAFASG